MFAIKTPKKVDFSTQLQGSLSKRSLKKSQLNVFWVNDRQEQCKKIIGQNRCFCTHAFEQHEIINTAKPFCLVEGCKCQCYQYVPFLDIRCMCRHSYKSHNMNSKMCQMCEKCLGFSTNWCCKCGLRYNQHQTVMKLKERSHNYESIGKKKSEKHLNESKLSLPKTSRLNLSAFKEDNTLIDQYEKQNHKYTVEIAAHLPNQQKKSKQKSIAIERINRKYNNTQLEDYYDNNVSLTIESGVGSHKTTPLQLYLKPHNYRYIEISKLLDKEYKKYDKEMEQTNNLKQNSRRF